MGQQVSWASACDLQEGASSPCRLEPHHQSLLGELETLADGLQLWEGGYTWVPLDEWTSLFLQGSGFFVMLFRKVVEADV